MKKRTEKKKDKNKTVIVDTSKQISYWQAARSHLFIVKIGKKQTNQTNIFNHLRQYT